MLATLVVLVLGVGGPLPHATHALRNAVVQVGAYHARTDAYGRATFRLRPGIYVVALREPRCHARLRVLHVAHQHATVRCSIR